MAAGHLRYFNLAEEPTQPAFRQAFTQQTV